jgi:hypothetical protein
VGALPLPACMAVRLPTRGFRRRVVSSPRAGALARASHSHLCVLCLPSHALPFPMPPPDDANARSCHGNRTCETQNWKKETCTPDMGTWCERPPPGYCPCAGCPPKGTAGAW